MTKGVNFSKNGVKAFVRFENEIGCEKKSNAELLEVYACQRVNSRSDVEVEEDLMEFAWVYLSEV